LENYSEGKTSAQMAKHISEKALRYDLTVPFARYVVMHQHEISFPFKRYQIQPVWRADRPQKGRYREFHQCDVDVIGSNSLLNELELIQLTIDIFNKLNISVVIKINNRKILEGFAESLGLKDKFNDFITILDKIDKITIHDAKNELHKKGFSDDEILKIVESIKSMRQLESNDQKLDFVKEFCKTSEIGMKGIQEVENIFDYLKSLPAEYSGFLKTEQIEFDFSLARGLNYYTGAIFEVKARNIAMGSICGGGRYDDLTGIFGLPNVSGVGISFGADRIYDVLSELRLFPKNTDVTSQLLFVNLGAEEEKYCLALAAETRKNGINTELFPHAAKLKKQLDYANANHIPYVAIIGTNEIKSKQITVKNMNSGEQMELNINKLIELLKGMLF
ncbi:MAG: histidine--tRNA ligase, partial [Bacteroidetes bacterium]|nr:histidine--tRNA ligase [Bacteroidota bacterium]